MSDILTGWKEIAAYMRISEKTAKRYRKHRGLPVGKDPAGHPVINKKIAEEWKMKYLSA
jgi:hypothetical protein